MKGNKLTYYQICKLARQGQYDLIPKGYKIVWLYAEPRKIIDDIIGAECITFTRNSFIQPCGLKFSGEYVPVVPKPHFDEIIDYEITEDLLEYGTVPIKTEFIFTKFRFLYKKDEWENLSNYLDGIYGSLPVKKCDATFDFDITYKGTIWHFKNVLVESLEYPSLEYEVRDNSYIEVKLVCDYFTKESIQVKDYAEMFEYIRSQPSVGNG